MKCVFLTVLLAAAATAAVFSNDVPDVVVTDVFELADAADFVDEAEETAVATRLNLSVGTIGVSDVRVYNADHVASAIVDHFHVRDITIHSNRPITAIRVTRVGVSQNAIPSILSGGIGNYMVIVRIRSAVGRGFNYNVQVHGR